MRTRILKCPLAVCTAIAVLALSATPARAVSLTPQNGGFVQDLLDNSANVLGPPPTARFTEPGPITVNSGEATPLYRGPGASADALLFVLSSYTNPTGGSMAVNGTSADFGASFDNVFPSVPGIANGEINGIKLTDSYHAVILGEGFDFSGATDSEILSAKITLAAGITAARVDIFGLLKDSSSKSGYRIINNTPNSGGVGVPEPSSVLASLVALGIGGLLIRRKLA